jgi:hypothetical protein
MWQPVPVQQPVAAPVSKPSGANVWIVLLLIVIVILFCAIAWMRTAKMVPETEETVAEEEEEKEEPVEQLPAELPVPAQVSEYEKYEKFDEEAVRDFVSANLLNFSRQKEESKPPEEEEVFHIPANELPPEIKPSSRRLVADESQEVIDYAKRREALFKN